MNGIHNLRLVPSRAAAGIRAAGGPIQLLRHVQASDVRVQTVMLVAALAVLVLAPMPIVHPWVLAFFPVVYVRAVVQRAIWVGEAAADARGRVPLTTREWLIEVDR